MGIALNPTFLFANKTSLGSFTIYHNNEFDKEFLKQVNEATNLRKASELYDPNYKIDIYLNDGSNYTNEARH